MVTASKDGTWRVWNINVRYHQQEDPKNLLQRQQEVITALRCMHMQEKKRKDCACWHQLHEAQRDTGLPMQRVLWALAAAQACLYVL